MSALGQKQKFAVQLGMSALPPTATSMRHLECPLWALADTAIYSITSSARESMVGGTVKPIAFAVLRLITS